MEGGAYLKLLVCVHFASVYAHAAVGCNVPACMYVKECMEQRQIEERQLHRHSLSENCLEGLLLWRLGACHEMVFIFGSNKLCDDQTTVCTTVSDWSL